MTAGTAGLPSARSDRAERYLFTALPLLSAKERRALAMAELTQTDAVTIAAELGVSEQDLGILLTSARKALRRTRAPLDAGGRCERTERLVSDALDGNLHSKAQARHDAHLDRCPRCREHVELLEEARTTLRSGFLKSLEIKPASLDAPPPVAEAPRLRAVPAPPPQTAGELAPSPPARAPQPVAAAQPAPVLAPPRAEVADAPRPKRQLARKATNTAAVAAVLIALIAVLLGGVAAFDDKDNGPAPWANPTAPTVAPAPLSGQ